MKWRTDFFFSFMPFSADAQAAGFGARSRSRRIRKRTSEKKNGEVRQSILSCPVSFKCVHAAFTRTEKLADLLRTLAGQLDFKVLINKTPKAPEDLIPDSHACVVEPAPNKMKIMETRKK